MVEYLFLLVIKAFSWLLDDEISKGEFSYHPNCANLNLSHVMFVDDLFIMAKADTNSPKVVDKILNEFKSVNKAKCEMFFAGVSDMEKGRFA